jgi:hypothetical protein
MIDDPDLKKLKIKNNKAKGNITTFITNKPINNTDLFSYLNKKIENTKLQKKKSTFWYSQHN